MQSAVLPIIGVFAGSGEGTATSRDTVSCVGGSMSCACRSRCDACRGCAVGGASRGADAAMQKGAAGRRMPCRETERFTCGYGTRAVQLCALLVPPAALRIPPVTSEEGDEAVRRSHRDTYNGRLFLPHVPIWVLFDTKCHWYKRCHAMVEGASASSHSFWAGYCVR